MANKPTPDKFSRLSSYSNILSSLSLSLSLVLSAPSFGLRFQLGNDLFSSAEYSLRLAQQPIFFYSIGLDRSSGCCFPLGTTLFATGFLLASARWPSRVSSLFVGRVSAIRLILINFPVIYPDRGYQALSSSTWFIEFLLVSVLSISHLFSPSVFSIRGFSTLEFLFPISVSRNGFNRAAMLVQTPLAATRLIYRRIIK